MTADSLVNGGHSRRQRARRTSDIPLIPLERHDYAASVPRTKTLILLAKKTGAAAEAGSEPRSDISELVRILDAETLNFNDVARSTHPLVRGARSRGPYWGLAMLAILRRREFDNIYATGEDIGMPLAALLHAARAYGQATVLVHHGGTPKRRVALRVLGSRVWRNVICVSERQREVLLNQVRLPSQKIHRFNQGIDESFFEPLPSDPNPGDYVFSCGRDSRDYPTLTAAARELPIPFRVVASGWASHAGYRQAENMDGASNIVVEHGLSYKALRDAYAGARFVVFPLDSVDYAAGVTGMCEAMAMGKAVIASASPGIAEYMRDGRSGFVVPVGDVRAMRKAIERLWADPNLAVRMGQYNRRWAVEQLTVTHYARRVAGLFGVDVLESNAELDRNSYPQPDA
jgi:glycosyltransferase involved in cell wall biosynthesis